MDQFQDQVAVITGGASGIGKGLAERCLQEGMKVILADIEDDALQATVSAFRANYNNPIVGQITDVSIASSLEALRDRALAEFGAVHLLFNNAGVGGAGGAWTGTEKDWDWVIGVNLMSVVHGQRLFLPVMLEQATPGHIVNTASVAGLIGGVTNAPYSVTKHGVVALTEHLHRDLLLAGRNWAVRCSALASLIPISVQVAATGLSTSSMRTAPPRRMRNSPCGLSLTRFSQRACRRVKLLILFSKVFAINNFISKPTSTLTIEFRVEPKTLCWAEIRTLSCINGWTEPGGAH
jgi:NAD(P)-dependent dehydrogenase (short-subunit alcohol dehydrogenase family)